MKSSQNAVSDKLRRLVTLRKHKRFRDLAALLTCIDQLGPIAISVPELASAEKHALRVGITGPPGAGKSTLINSLIKDFRRRGLTVAVLAIDPSSPFTHGAILGDRIRYSENFNDNGVFIRSLGSRGSSGGLSGSTYLFLRALDLWEFDVVLIETVGVGQTELDVMYVADLVAVVLVPEGGDAVQAMKAGLMEIADLFVVNKCDRPGADSFANELKDTINIGENTNKIEVLSASATNEIGIQNISDWILSSERKKTILSKRSDKKRIQAEAIAMMLMVAMNKFKKIVKDINSIKELSQIIKKINK